MKNLLFILTSFIFLSCKAQQVIDFKTVGAYMTTINTEEFDYVSLYDNPNAKVFIVETYSVSQYQVQTVIRSQVKINTDKYIPQFKVINDKTVVLSNKELPINKATEVEYIIMIPSGRKA
jgi:hypothetical protein